VPPLHDAIAPLGGLVGTWSGTGRGDYPTIEPFDYAETVVVSHVGKPFLSYSQHTKHASTGLPLHIESGYWRMSGQGRVELVIAQPTGVAEILEGSLESGHIRLASVLVGRTSSAKDVSVVERDFVLGDDVLSYTVRMAAVGQDLCSHLEGELRRVE
jgi:hypothetical protein